MTKPNGELEARPLPDPFTRGLRRVLMALLALALLAFLFIVVRARMNGDWPPAFARLALPQTPTITPSLTPSPSDTLTPSRSPTEPPRIVLETQEGGSAPCSPSPLLTCPPSPLYFSLYENGHWRIYAYHPQALPFTRLTSGDWDDTMPAPSPDGARLAFVSNRDGPWDLYLLDLVSGELTRLTDTRLYDGAPTWSPDGQWLAYETYTTTLVTPAPTATPPASAGTPTPAPTAAPVLVSNLEIYILSLTGIQDPIRLTDHPGADSSPAWSPNGRQIAFVSDRSGDDEIWIANLDNPGERFRNLSLSPAASDRLPAWSPDGTQVAWSNTRDGLANIYVRLADPSAPRAEVVGAGSRPAWSPDGQGVAALITAPNQAYLAGYRLQPSQLAIPPLPLPAPVEGLAWSPAPLVLPLPPQLARQANLTPQPPWLPALTPQAGVPNGRQRVVEVEDLEAAYPLLHDLVDEGFIALRRDLAARIGWDYLSSLENAFVPLTAPLFPGMLQDWLYTGRAFALNPAPQNAGWLAVVREDIGAETYWRVFVRTRFQDGSQGRPLTTAPWNFNARFSGDPRAYEQGGAPAAIPQGYWFDLTALAQSYGWERLPALSTWRNAIPAARFNEFVLTDGLDWYLAMRELYPAEALNTPTSVVPPTRTPTRTRIPSRTPTVTRTRFPTRTPTLTRTAAPTRTLTPTPAP